MRSTILSRTRRWLGASALALLVGVGGVSTAFVLNGATANAQVQNAAQIVVPQASVQQGFADLVDAVKPAVVSILVEAESPNEATPRAATSNSISPTCPKATPSVTSSSSSVARRVAPAARRNASRAASWLPARASSSPPTAMW